jgi:hypothetical protein
MSTKTTTATASKKPAQASARAKPKDAPLSERLTDKQLVALASALQREDRTIDIPASLKSDEVAEFATSLMGLGLAVEASALRGQPVWRHDHDGQVDMTLKATALAIEVLGVEEDGDGAAMLPPNADADVPPATAGVHGPNSGAVTATKAASGTMAPEAARARSEPPQRRAGSKHRRLIELLSREEGASIAELAESLGWLPHTTRAALTGLRHKGYELDRQSSTGDRGSTYRIVAVPVVHRAAEGGALVEAA